MVDRQTEIAILQRRAIVAERYLRNQTQQEIANAMGVDISTISRDVKWFEEVLLEEGKLATAKRLAREIGKLNLAEREAWMAWERSKKPLEKKRSVQRKGGARGDVDEESEEVVQRDGNVAFLDAAIKCIDRRLDILGIKKQAVNVNVNNGQVNNQVTFEVGKITDMDRARRLCQIMGWPEPDENGNVPGLILELPNVPAETDGEPGVRDDAGGGDGSPGGGPGSNGVAPSGPG